MTWQIPLLIDDWILIVVIIFFYQWHFHSLRNFSEHVQVTNMTHLMALRLKTH